MKPYEKERITNLILEKRYVEARQILFVMKDYDSEALQLLTTLEQIVEEETARQKSRQRRATTYPPVMTRWTINLLVMAVCFILLRTIIPGLIYLLYDWRFNRSSRLDVNKVIVGIILSVGLFFGIASLLTVRL